MTANDLDANSGKPEASDQARCGDLVPHSESVMTLFAAMRGNLRAVLKQVAPNCPEIGTEISGTCAERGIANRTCSLVCRVIEDAQTLERFLKIRERFLQTLKEVEARITSEEADPRVRNFRIIDESLTQLKERIQLDYAGIWLLKGTEKIIVHENGFLASAKNREETLDRQIEEAINFTKESGGYAYLCPSESSGGGVDAIFVFRNIDGGPVGCLLLDDHDSNRRIGDEEVTEIVEVFYDQLHAVIREEEIRLVKKEIEQIRQELEEMRRALEHSHYDGLTGLLQQKFWREQFLETLERLRRSINGSVASVVFFDIDHFKRVNDTKGHTIGDRVLRRVGEMLRNGGEFFLRDEKGAVLKDAETKKPKVERYEPRAIDTSCRWGGEEILYVLEETGAAWAKVFAEKIRALISEEIFEDLDGNPFSITLSAGICEIRTQDLRSIPNGSDKVEHFLNLADRALYQAKAEGRNCSRVWNADGSETEAT